MPLRSAAVLFIVLFATTAFAQAPPVSLSNTESREFPSKITARPYSVFVALPDSYRTDQTRKYPVLYSTDAHIGFPLVTSLYRLMRLTDEVPEMIIVGIAGVDAAKWSAWRSVELSPTRVQSEEPMLTKSLGQDVRTGGGADFVRVLKDELIPDIERRYRATADRTFVGHSFGALFGTFMLFHAPDLFRRYILVSPALHWGDGAMFPIEEQFHRTKKPLRAEVFVAVGTLDTEQMVANAKRLVATLTERKYNGLALHSIVYENETHTSVFSGAFVRALRTFFPKPVK